MKWSAVLLLLTIAFSSALPTPMAARSRRGAGPHIGTLDVCRSAVPALSAKGAMPCMPESSCRHCPLLSAGPLPVDSLSFRPLMIVFRDERPPKV